MVTKNKPAKKTRAEKKLLSSNEITEIRERALEACEDMVRDVDGAFGDFIYELNLEDMDVDGPIGKFAEKVWDDAVKEALAAIRKL